MDIRTIKKLMELVQDSDIGEITVSQGEESVQIKRHNLRLHTPTFSAPVAASNEHDIPSEVSTMLGRVPSASGVTLGAGRAAASASDHVSASRHLVKSPMVGTVFLAPKPGASPFVDIGKEVKIGDTLCLIEAMKMYSPVEADKAGRLTKCLVENGKGVEFDQPLFIIE